MRFVALGLALSASLAAACAARSQSAPASGKNGDARATELTEDAADGGGLRACQVDAKDPVPCLEECDRGIAFACSVLASHLERGGLTPRDLTRAVFYYERACELRETASCVTAARMHAAGMGVPPNRGKQVELLGTACVLGEPLACNVPAKAYANGNGVTKDGRRARELWERACAGGVETACTALGDAGL